jgi:CRP-like cAMP-binding protein
MSELHLANGQAGLDLVASMTKEMREHQEAIARLSKERKKVVIALRTQFGSAESVERVTFKKIAQAMGTTDQSVYKILFPPTTKKKSEPISE